MGARSSLSRNRHRNRWAGHKRTNADTGLLAAGHGGAEYDAWLIRIDGNQFGSGFVAVNPNSKIPALMDRSGPVEITEETPGQWSGCCASPDIYSVRWPIDCIAEPYRDLMERQVVIELAGGIAEAIDRGERRKQAVLAFAESNLQH